MGHLLQVQIFAGTGRIFYFQVITIVVKELLQGLDQQVVDRKPDGAAPVGIATKEIGP